MHKLALVLILLCAACHSSSQEWPPWTTPGPLDVSHPPLGAIIYEVDLKPGFDQEASAKKISKEIGGRIATVFWNFRAFTIYDISESDVAKIRQMPEVEAITKSTYGQLAN